MCAGHADRYSGEAFFEAEKRTKIGGTASWHLPYRMLKLTERKDYYVFDNGLLRLLCRFFRF